LNPDRATGALAALQGGWSLLWYLAIHPTAPLAAIVLALPALLCARPAWRGAKLALGCAGFCAIGYLAHGLMELVANPAERLAALIASGVAAALLVSATIALRARRVPRPAAPI